MKVEFGISRRLRLDGLHAVKHGALGAGQDDLPVRHPAGHLELRDLVLAGGKVRADLVAGVEILDGDLGALRAAADEEGHGAE